MSRLARWLARREAPEGTSWPLRLTGTTPHGEGLLLRPLRPEDESEFHSVRRANRAWLEPWDATVPDGSVPARTFAELVGHYDTEAIAGRMLPFAIQMNGRIVGQVNLTTIVYGSFRSCAAGYWVSRAVAGRLVMPTSLALAGDHAFTVLGLHRLEVNIRPENTASLAVVRKLGFRDEGIRRRMLHIDGDWRDHRSFALTSEDLGGESLLGRLRTSHSSHFGDTPGEVRRR